MDQKLRIQELQDQKGISNVDLAKKMSVSKEVVSYWRSGKRTPPISTLENLHKVLGVHLLELFESPDGFKHNYDMATGEWLGILKE